MKRKTLIINCTFAIILGIQTWCWISYCGYSRLSCDEFFSYGLANGTEDYIFWDMNQIEAHANEGGWIQGKDIWSYFVVDEGEGFSFDRVWWNQEHDVHPPFYYILLNSVSSFFPGVFSKWFGKAISILFLLLSQFVIFKLSKLFFGEKPIIIIPVIAWGFANGAFYLSNLVRMYAMLSFFCLLLVYVHCKIYMTGLNKQLYWQLIVAIALGGLTHYYFCLFAAIYCFLFFCILLWQKECRQNVIAYCVNIVVGALLAIMIFPKMIYHIFGGYQGDNVKDGILSLNFQFIEVCDRINSYVLYDKGILVGVITVLLFLVYLWREKKDAFKWTAKKIMWINIALAGALYAVAMMKICVKARAYYVSPCFAVLSVAVSFLLIRLLQWMGERYRGILLTLAILLLVITTVPRIIEGAKVADAPNVSFMKIYEQYTHRDCIFVYEAWDNLFTDQIGLMAEQDEIYCLDVSQLETATYPEALNQRRTNDDLLIAVTNDEQKEEKIKIIEERLQMNATEIVEGRFSFYALQ